MGSSGSVEMDFKQMFIVFGSIAAFLLALILIWDWELAADRKQLALLRDFEVTNETGSTISVWARRGIDPPPRGFSISRYRSADCSPPECDLQSGITRSWTVDTKSDSTYPPFLVTAWSNETELILYTGEFTIEQMEQAGWKLVITDQR